MKTKALAFAALAISVTACGKETPTTADSVPVQTERQFLEGVPADTAYAIAAVEPAPLGELLPWAKTLDDAAMPSPERVAELMADPELKPRKRRALALLQELTGHYSPEGLAKLGFSANPRMVLYGIGVLPALRLEIEDAQKVEQFLARVHAAAELTPETKRVGSQEYFTVPGLRNNRTVVFAIQDNLFLAGVTTPEAEELFAAHLLGERETLGSLDESTVKDVADNWGLKAYSVGYLDLARVAQIVLAPKDGLNNDIWKTLSRSKKPVSDACRNETLAMVEQVPRFVFGSESWSADSVSFGAGVDVRSDLVSQLAATKTGAPLRSSAHADGATGVAGFGFDLGQAAELLRARASAIAEQPFQCEWYAGINKGAERLSSRWTILPPMIASIQGGTVLVKDIRRTTDGEPPEVDAVAAFTTSQPVELWDFAKSFNQELFEVQVTPTTGPVALPATALKKLQTPQLFTKPNAIALTSGAWTAEQLTAQELASKDSPFLFLRYDAEKIAERFDLDDPEKPFRHALRGTGDVRLDPTPQGLHLRATYTRQTGE